MKYVIITPAHNEEAYIEKTIQSVVSQAVKPEKWVIVSDGSTDRTDEIVNRYILQNNWMVLVRLPEHRDRQFAAKVQAFNAGYEKVKGLEYDLIGNLDADISFGADYYQKVIGKFKANAELGIAGGTRYDLYDGRCEEIIRSRNSVMGAIQLFQRQCYEDIGGYIPLKRGGIDAVAEIMARMHGWKVETFPEIKVYHHRRTGTADRNVLKANFRAGESEYLIGYHPVFELLRVVKQIYQAPFLLGAIFLLMGYLWAFVKKYEREIPEDVIAYLRKEQMNRLKSIIRSKKKITEEFTA